jgi:hypothetical protein
VSTCDRARVLIDQFVVDELRDADRAELAEHLRGCPACAAELGGTTRLLELLSSLPDVAPREGFDARILAAAIAERDRRQASHGWIRDLWTQAWRGAVRTTGTFLVSVVAITVLGVSFVVGAATIAHVPLPFVNIIPGPYTTPGPTHSQEPAPSLAPSTPTVEPATPKPAPRSQQPGESVPVVVGPVIVPTPSNQPQATPTAAPTEAPTPTPTPTATPAPVTPTPTEAPAVTPTPVPTETATPTPTPSPTPEPASPTPKPRRTQTPAPTPTPLPTAAPTPAPTPSP